MKVSICFLMLLSIAASAQQKLKSLEVSDTIATVAIDRPGDIYVLTRNGQMQKFNETGMLQVLFKSDTTPTLFEPRDGSRLFAYYRPTQQYDFLKPNFEVASAYRIDPAFVIQPWLICPSGDFKLWVLDAADHSLKKINTRESVVDVEVVIDSMLIRDATVFTIMREYQGFVFLLNPREGIYIFNALGKHIKTLKTTGIDTFNFLGEELYYVQDQKLKFFDLFSADFREMPLPQRARQAIITDKYLYLVRVTTIDIFQL